MELDRYLDAAQREANAMASDARAFGPRKLHQIARSVRTAGMLAWMRENGTAIAEYCLAPPAQRRRRLQRLPETDQALMLIASLYQARLAYALLEHVCNRGLTAGPETRFLLGQAAAAAADLHADYPSIWPFDPEPGMADPFRGA